MSREFAIGTGSRDLLMNRMCSVLGSYRFVSNFAAHSPPMLGCEATTLRTDLGYFAMRRAAETDDSRAGASNSFLRRGTYHFEERRKCCRGSRPSRQVLAWLR
jgi:DNA helicase II / ATP-dependent DNA helicase PcrA